MIWLTLRILVHCVAQALRHPRSPVCSWGNPTRIPAQSPVPWYASVALLMLGIACWVASSVLAIAGLDEAARALVYLPLGNLYGMSRQVAAQADREVTRG